MFTHRYTHTHICTCRQNLEPDVYKFVHTPSFPSSLSTIYAAAKKEDKKEPKVKVTGHDSKGKTSQSEEEQPTTTVGEEFPPDDVSWVTMQM